MTTLTKELLLKTPNIAVPISKSSDFPVMSSELKAFSSAAFLLFDYLLSQHSLRSFSILFFKSCAAIRSL
jgi:hypothetical protein